MSQPFREPSILCEEDDPSTFDCGNDALNTFLRSHALQNQRNNSARTYVSLFSQSKKVAGYYTLCAASAEYELAPDRIRKGLARHPVPLILLARLAVDNTCQGQGLGAGLLRNAFIRFLQAQETIGARALLAHAKDPSAKSFYEKWGFQSADEFPLHLYILAKTIKSAL